MFDWGEEENIKRYGRKTSPEYNISKITSPHLVLMYGESDKVVPPKMVEAVKKKLKGNRRVF